VIISKTKVLYDYMQKSSGAFERQHQ